MNNLNFWNGFYDMSCFKSINDLQDFYIDAINVADKVFIDYLDCNESWSRQTCDKFTPEEYVKRFIDFNTHNVCIDRKIYGDRDTEGEIGSSTMRGKSYFIFIYLNRDEFDKIIKKYNLKPKQ